MIKMPVPKMAHFFLDYMGDETDKATLVENMRDELGSAVALYIGEGFVPLVVIIEMMHCVEDVYGAFEDWARRSGREEEIGEIAECDICSETMVYSRDGWLCQIHGPRPEPEEYGFYQSSYRVLTMDELESIEETE